MFFTNSDKLPLREKSCVLKQISKTCEQLTQIQIEVGFETHQSSYFNPQK